MSMISELVDRLRVEAKSMGTYGTDYMATLLMRSADTIEMLSEKARESKEVVVPKKCKGCDSASKIIEAYSRGFEDGAEAVKALPNCSEIPNNSTTEDCSMVDKDINVRSKDETTHSQHIQHVGSVETMSCQECKHWDVYKGCRERVCKYEPKDEPQTEMTTEQIVNELLSIKKILDDGKMPKQSANCSRKTKDYYAKDKPHIVGKHADVIIIDEPQTERSE